jgi:hypothetical protein
VLILGRGSDSRRVKLAIDFCWWDLVEFSSWPSIDLTWVSQVFWIFALRDGHVYEMKKFFGTGGLTNFFVRTSGQK